MTDAVTESMTRPPFPSHRLYSPIRCRVTINSCVELGSSTQPMNHGGKNENSRAESILDNLDGVGRVVIFKHH